jgi:hypothetical protein
MDVAQKPASESERVSAEPGILACAGLRIGATRDSEVSDQELPSECS